jgi:hypothetical protein
MRGMSFGCTAGSPQRLRPPTGYPRSSLLRPVSALKRRSLAEGGNEIKRNSTQRTGHMPLNPAWQKILCKRYSTKSRMALWKQGENWLESLAHHHPGSAERYARVSVNAAPRFRGNYCKGISQLLCLRTIVGVDSVPNPNSGTLRASAL